jgi:hypothetical protein
MGSVIGVLGITVGDPGAQAEASNRQSRMLLRNMDGPTFFMDDFCCIIDLSSRQFERIHGN